MVKKKLIIIKRWIGLFRLIRIIIISIIIIIIIIK